jgi:rfaE bifunctional protein nucleotidyltransferase chain/domain
MILNSIKGPIAARKMLGKKMVFTNGCFDVLHPGHFHLLKSASELGDYLVVGLNSDESVKKLKGSKRPYHNLELRAQQLLAIRYVDFIIPFEEETPENLIHLLKPNVLVKGGDYSPEQIVGSDFVLKTGGTLHIVPFLPGHASSHFLDDEPKST